MTCNCADYFRVFNFAIKIDVKPIYPGLNRRFTFKAFTGPGVKNCYVSHNRKLIPRYGIIVTAIGRVE